MAYELIRVATMDARTLKITYEIVSKHRTHAAAVAAGIKAAKRWQREYGGKVLQYAADHFAIRHNGNVEPLRI